MPRYSTYPYLFDESKSISTIKLRKWGYLKTPVHIGSSIIWSRNGVETSSIGIIIKMNDYESSITLKYNCNDTDYDYKVRLVSIPSNLGKGEIWYFICPFTQKRCRKLHLINGRFMHRSALPSGMYSKQTQSKTWRQMEKIYSPYFDSEKNYKELHSKYFKRYYNGKPTKRYIKLMNRIKQSESVSISELKHVFKT